MAFADPELASFSLEAKAGASADPRRLRGKRASSTPRAGTTMSVDSLSSCSRARLSGAWPSRRRRGESVLQVVLHGRDDPQRLLDLGPLLDPGGLIPGQDLEDAL